jgi:hypothetical protein
MMSHSIGTVLRRPRGETPAGWRGWYMAAASGRRCRPQTSPSSEAVTGIVNPWHNHSGSLAHRTRMSPVRRGVMVTIPRVATQLSWHPMS